MSTINTPLSILRSMIIKCVCIRSYNKQFRRPQTRPANFLALIEIASKRSWLIFLFDNKPGYLPEQPGSHGPGERAAHSVGVSGWSPPAEITEEKPVSSGFLHSKHGLGEARVGEKREERRADQAQHHAGRAEVDHLGERALTYSLAPMSTNEQLGRPKLLIGVQALFSGLTSLPEVV